MLAQLNGLAHALGLTVRCEIMEGDASDSSGGLCRLKGEPVVILNARASKDGQIRALASALRRFDLSGLYVRPALRDLLERSPEVEREDVCLSK